MFKIFNFKSKNSQRKIRNCGIKLRTLRIVPGEITCAQWTFKKLFHKEILKVYVRTNYYKPWALNTAAKWRGLTDLAQIICTPTSSYSKISCLYRQSNNTHSIYEEKREPWGQEISYPDCRLFSWDDEQRLALLPYMLRTVQETDKVNIVIWG